MVHKPSDLNSFEFAVLCGLRVTQLIRGCVPRVVVAESEKLTMTAQREIAEGKVVREAKAE